MRWRLRLYGNRFETIQNSFPAAQNTLFMMADALDPPFQPDAFDLVAALNLLDAVKIPLTLIGQMDALLQDGGDLILGSPYEWQNDIVESDEWLVSEHMDSAQMVRSILTGQHP